MRWHSLLPVTAWLLAISANADTDTPPDAAAVARTCSTCHLGGNTLDDLTPQELVDGITRIRNGQLAHPAIPEDVDAQALAAAVGEPGPTSP